MKNMKRIKNKLQQKIKTIKTVFIRMLATIFNKNNKMEKDIDSIRIKNDEFFNNNLTLLTTGSLVISVGFIEKITPIQTSVTLWLLYFSWILFIFSLIINLYSYIFGSNFGRKLSKYIYDNTKSEMKQEDVDKLTEYQYNKIIKYNKINNIINHFVYSFFISGVIFICIFVFINFNNVKNMSDKKTQEKTMLNEGFSYSLPEKTTKVITIEKTENTIVVVTKDLIQITNNDVVDDADKKK